MNIQEEIDNFDESDKRRPVTFYLEADIYAEIKRISRKMGMNAASALRMAARNFLEKHTEKNSST
jgi:transposase-like protein